MKLLPTIKKSIIAFALLPALLYAGIPPTLQSDASQRMTRDIMDQALTSPPNVLLPNTQDVRITYKRQNTIC